VGEGGEHGRSISNMGKCVKRHANESSYPQVIHKLSTAVLRILSSPPKRR
jgi:hypothetical protein